MAECPGGRTNRGTRSQFRLGAPGLGLFKGLYPIHLGDIMDVEQSSQTGILSARDLISPSKGTRTRTVREYEQTIDELKKENFDLKLRVYMYEESNKKLTSKDKDGSSPTKDTVQVVVQLKLETESLRKDLAYKEKVLQDALKRAEKYESDFKELEKKYAELQNELSSLSELPSKQEYLLLLDEKENLLKQTESLEEALLEKNEEIHEVNERIEVLANQNTLLEEKIKKRSLAIQGFVYKNYKEKEMFPDELRNIVISATQAAKNKNKDDLAIAVKNFSSALNQISSVQLLNESEEKENIGSSQAKCLKEEFLEKSSAFLPSQTVSCTELSHMQGLKEVLAERNTPSYKQFHSLDSAARDPYMKEKILNENSVNVVEKDVLESFNFSPIPSCSVEEENLISFSNKHSSQLCSVGENNLINIEAVSSPVTSSDLIHQDEGLSKRYTPLLSCSAEESYQLIRENEKLKLEIKEKLAVIQDLKTTCKELEMRGVYLQEREDHALKGNEKLKFEITEKLAAIQDLQATCKKLELKGIHLQKRENDALKASKCYSACTQTDIAGSNLLDEYEVTRLQKDAKLSSDVNELREDVLRLLLAVEDKNKELVDVKQTLSAVQEDLNRALNTSNNLLDKDYMNERNELHERLAFSSSVNVELMKHLRNLESFMEDLLQNKVDSSMESITEKSDFLSNVSRCLNESLKLSNVLSDHLSICEGSKLFEECESVLYKNASYSDAKSLPNLNLSEMIRVDQHSSSYPGTHHLEEYIPFVRKSDEKMGKELDGQLCWRCWQQLNSSPLNKSEVSHLMQNNASSKYMPYPSSDSDIWSEPDRNVSMQRIGISLQNSPVASKSPRKLRLKEKRLSNKLSSDLNTSSSEMHRWSKQRRHGSVSRRLFARESIKNLDFTSEKFYFLLAQKYSKLKTLLEALENEKDSGVSDAVWIRMNTVVASLGEALQKLHIAKENAKNFPSAVCGKCVMLELFMDLKASHKEADFCIDDSSSENEILQEFRREVHLLKEACKEPFSIFPEIVDQRSQSTQSDSTSDEEQVKISELEGIIVDLNNKNKSLNKNLGEVKRLLSKEKEVLESVKLENLELSKQINNLKKELLDIKQNEKELSLKNEELVEELASANRNKSELNFALKGLEEKRNESNATLNQLTADLQDKKLNLVNMNMKCLEYEKELNAQKHIKEEYEVKLRNLESASLSEKETLYNNISVLSSEKNHYQKELEDAENEKLTLKQENASLSADLKSKCSELSSLQETISMLQEAKENLNVNCRDLQIELKNTKEDLQSLKKKCSAYEDEVRVKFKANEEYCRQLKQLETESLNEKHKLLAEISELTLERENICQKLNTEKECYERLMVEKDELNKNFAKSCLQISSLKQLNEDLKNKQQNLLQKNEFFENALLSSNAECDSLSKDLKCMRETLQNLESKCMVYEKEIIAAAGLKDNLVECLININCEFSTHRQKLNEMCNSYGSETSVVCDETSVSEFIPVIDEDNVKRLCENLCSESKKLLQCVNMILELLKSFHLKSVETKVMAEKHNLKNSSLKKQMEFHKTEGEHFKLQNDHFQQVIDKLQKSISEKEKSIQYSAYEIQSLKEKIRNTEEEIQKGNELLKRKDDEITMLQERVFNLQSYVNIIMADKTNVQDKSPTKVQKFVNDKVDSVLSDSQLLSSSSLKQASKTAKTNDYEDPSQSADESFISVSSIPEAGKNSCCEKYLKKYHSLQTKLALCKKHIEILEKEKDDLRGRYLDQLQIKRDSVEKGELDTKLVDLESKLEQKKAFISELKAELLKTCNSLIDKEKEVDDLKEKLSQCERKLKCTALDMSNHSIGRPKTVDANIRSLRNYKWELIQTIFDIQRKFYEQRGIHLNYFDRFKDHVDSLYSLQLTHSLSKSESMPLLGSHSLKYQMEQGEDKVKNLVGLELDIECLEHLKIFLNRFALPCVLQTSQKLDEKSPDLDETEKGLSSDKLTQETEIEKLNSSKLERISSLGISFPECIAEHLSPVYKQSSQKSVGFENFASKVSHHLDCIENFFLMVKKCQWLESLDLSAKDSVDKAEVKSLLLKIFKVIRNLQEGADKLFSFNALLKSFDFVVSPSIPLSFSRTDMSDRESLMSEETIGISRSESPLSFEELCPVKLPCPGTLALEEKTMKPKSLGGRGTVTEPYSVKVTTIGSSCDSVCQRSHYSSPDLGIESDPNHESSAPEQKEESINKYQRLIMEEKKIILKPQQKTAFTRTESAGRFKGIQVSDTLYSIGELRDYELLKREIQESLVGMRSVLTRTGVGLEPIAKYTSPRKALEYKTLKAIKDSCIHIEVCLEKADSLIGKFWIASCPTEKEWNALIEENQSLTEQLGNLRAMIQKQEGEFKKAMGKLEHAQLIKANMEKKISKKLVKTKKVIRQAELKLLENRCQNLPPVPKYPSEQANLVQQKENV